MRILFAMLGVLAMAGTAFAGTNPASIVDESDAVPCNLTCFCYEWDFAVSNQGFTAPHSCDTGGAAVWQYGTTSYVPGTTGPVWGTILNGMYPVSSGDALWSPEFTVTNDCKYVEIYHYFDTENSYDGGNVKFRDTLITPQGGYTGTICTSTSYYAFCVDMEQGWMGSSSGWRAECFDLSQFMGQSGHLSFEFGSDSSVTYAGWYIAYVKVGAIGATPVEDSTWGEIKGLFR